MVLLNGFLEEFEAPSKGKHGQNFRVCMLSSRICPPPSSWALSLYESDEPLPRSSFLALPTKARIIVFRFIIEYIVA
jgi:hypothetical protein